MAINSSFRWPLADDPVSALPVAVIGAAGGVGEGITEALLQKHRRVIAVGRDADRLAALGERLRTALPQESTKLSLHVGDAGSPAEDVADALLAEYGPLGGAVITIGSFDGAGRAILDTDSQTLDATLDANLASHFHAIRAVLPALDRRGALVHLSGQSADFPYPGSALIGATNAARKSLVLALAQELAGRGPRIYELVIGVTRTRPRAAAGHDDPRWISAQEVGDRVDTLLEGSLADADEALHYALRPDRTTATPDHRDAGYRISRDATIGHVALRVSALEPALRFYRDALGFEVKHRMGEQAAFLAAGDYHHHLALLAAPQPGLEHVAIRFPHRAAIAGALEHLRQQAVEINSAADHGTTESFYLADPDGNGIELYIDK